jgi:hypothetical protein
MTNEMLRVEKVCCNMYCDIIQTPRSLLQCDDDAWLISNQKSRGRTLVARRSDRERRRRTWASCPLPDRSV